MTSTRRAKPGPALATAIMCVLLTAACGEQDTSPTPTTPAPAAAGAPTTSRGPGDAAANLTKGSPMDIRIHIAGTQLQGTLDDTHAARDFATLLPLTLTLTDFHATEKVADLPRARDTSAAPAGTAAKAGDITYYAPWGNLAIFYRDFAHSPGLIHLGTLEPAALTTLRNHDNPLTMTIDIPTHD